MEATSRALVNPFNAISTIEPSSLPHPMVIVTGASSCYCWYNFMKFYVGYRQIVQPGRYHVEELKMKTIGAIFSTVSFLLTCYRFRE